MNNETMGLGSHCMLLTHVISSPVVRQLSADRVPHPGRRGARGVLGARLGVPRRQLCGRHPPGRLRSTVRLLPRLFFRQTGQLEMLK